VHLSTILDIITTVFLLATLIVLIIYTYQTYRLRQETTKQTELSLRPFIIISVFKDNAGLSQRLIYKNIGHSPALDIETEPFDAEAYILNFGKWGLIEPNEKKDLSPKGEGKTGLSDAFIQAVRTPSFTPKELDEFDNEREFILNIHYKNIEKVSYQTQVKINRKGIEIISTGKI
jgi:heme/copper-type cytochrome/quinol oxidase subunit 2